MRVPNDLIPRVLPYSWEKVADIPIEGQVYVSRWGLRVIVTADFERDDRLWLHVSLSKKHKLPSWDDVREVKDLFIGKDRLAIQVLPPESEYVNCHPHTLHLWSCLEGPRIVPDFRQDNGLI